MSPRQLLRANEVRSAAVPSTLGQKTDRQVRQFPDAAGNSPVDATMDDLLDVVTSRLRLNAGALDWRDGPAGGGGGGGAVSLTHEVPEGDRDGINRVYATSQAFVPQTLQLFVNGLRQMLDPSGDADFTISESAGTGTGYDRIELAWAPLDRDRLYVDYQQVPAST